MMRRIVSRVNTQSAEFKTNHAKMTDLVQALREQQRATRFDRPKRDLERVRRQNKLSVRERLELLVDPGSPFLELSSLAACRSYDGQAPGAGLLTGIGLVNGRQVMVHASDPSVKGGAWYPHSIKKIVRALDVALENHLPVVHLCDSAGGYLPLQHEFFADRQHGGRIFRNQVELSKRGIPQVAVVLGYCTAGGAYVPALSDYNIIVRGNGGIFLGGPPLVKAATGEVVSANELGGCDVHTRISGTADYPAANEEDAIQLAREIVGEVFPAAQPWQADRADPEQPFYESNELYGIIPTDRKRSFEIREVIARIVDGSRFHEYQPVLGTTLVCGFARIFGWKVGIVANNGVLFSDSSLKAAHFIQLCDRDKVPLLFLQNITGFMIGREYEARGITKDGAKMITAQASVRVPKFTVMVNSSFGAGNYGMCGRAFDPRFLFSWPNSQIGVMGGDQAANTMVDIKRSQLLRNGGIADEDEITSMRDAIFDDYENHSDAYWSTSELWDDGLIDPVDTRNALAVAISASMHRPLDPLGSGILRL